LLLFVLTADDTARADEEKYPGDPRLNEFPRLTQKRSRRRCVLTKSVIRGCLGLALMGTAGTSSFLYGKEERRPALGIA
jgi:hypothetical protein